MPLNNILRTPVHYLVLCAALAMGAAVSPGAQAEAREQKVRLEVALPEGGGQCEVRAVFRGDHDNCKNDKAKGRDDCPKDSGCVCTRQEKHLSWEMKDKESFEIRFDQGSANPFVMKGDHECSLASNKKGKLRCRVKGKDVPAGSYRYSIHHEGCNPATAEFKIY